MKRIYLDHTATTPVDGQVFDAMRPYFSQAFGNASSVHWYGRQARQALERARETVALAIGARPSELVFTSGGTESNNLAIRGFVRSHVMEEQGTSHIITSRAEHHSVLQPCEELEKEGQRVTFAPVDEFGCIEAGYLRGLAIDSRTLVSVMAANNEVGTISPLAEIASIVHDAGGIVHTDAVQMLGKLPLDVNTLGADMLSLSAHKVYGPKGIGALYIRKGTRLASVVHGGGQERGRRAGTESVALAVGFAKAVELCLADMNEEIARLQGLRDSLQTELCARFPSLLVNGHPAHRLPHVLSVSFHAQAWPMEGEMLIVNLDLRGIAVASGSACTSGSVQPSHVLLAMGRDAGTARATVRFAFGRGNTIEDVRMAADAVEDAIREMTGSQRSAD